MCAVRLNTPSHQTNIDNGEKLHAWVANIEQMTLADSARKMHETLRRYNHSTMEVNQRHQIMDELQLPITRLLASLENSYLGSINHTRKRELQDSGKLIRQLLSEACCAHNIIINELTVKDNSPAEQAMLSHNIYYALCYQARYLMEHFLTYQPISGDIWGEIKLLFRYARQHKLESVEIVDKEGIPQTITTAFTTALLFASINPFRLQQQEIVLSYQIITQWARHCQLVACDEQWISDGEWLIDLSSERPPEYLSSKQAILDHSSLLRINIDRLINENQQKLLLDDNIPLKQQLLDRLQHGWKSAPPRSYERRSSFQETEIAVGFDNCHQLLIDHEIEASQDQQGEDTLWSLHLANRWLEGEMDPSERILQELLEVDVSIGGYGLRCPQHNSKKIHKMDLVLIRQPNIDIQTWRIGQVRWKQDEANGIDSILGVCLLSENASAIIINNATSDMDGALLVPSGDFENPLATLIVPNGYKPGDTIQCLSSKQNVRLKLSDEVCSGGDFKQFNFELIGPKSGQ